MHFSVSITNSKFFQEKSKNYLLSATEFHIPESKITTEMDFFPSLFESPLTVHTSPLSSTRDETHLKARLRG